MKSARLVIPTVMRLVIPTVVAWGAVLATGCRSYPGAGAFTAIPGFADSTPTPTRASGTETRSDFKLQNGLRVLLEENHATSVVAVQVWLDAGAARDPAGRPGLSYLLKNLLMQSPGLGELATLGGKLSAQVSHDAVEYRAILASPYVGRGLQLLAGVLCHPEFPPQKVFESTRQASVVAARQAAWTPPRLAAELAFRLAFRDGVYGAAIEGAPPQLSLASESEAASFHDQFYVASRAVVVMVGDFNTAQVRALLQGSFGAWPSSPSRGVPTAASAPQVASPGEGPALVVEAADVSQPEIAIGFRTPPIGHGDTAALEMLAAIAGRAGAGRLHTNVVRNRQMASRADAYLFEGRQAGMLVANATLAPGHVDEAVRAILDELLRLGRERVDAADLERARLVVDGEDAADKSSLDGYAAKLGWFAALAGDASFEKKYRDRFRKVDAAEVESVARKYLRASNMVMAVVIPEGAAKTSLDDGRIDPLTARLRVIARTCEQSMPIPSPSKRASASAVGQDFVDYRLPSGVRLLVIPDDTAAQISVRALWLGGSRMDDARLSGASALIARLLPRGTRSRGAAPLDAEMADIAGTLEGIAGADLLGLRADFLASRWERGLELIADVLRNPLFAEEDVERERRVQLDLIRRRDEDPSALALRAFREALYGAHPYRQDGLGTLESVSALTRRRLLDHFRRSYKVATLTVAVVGAVAPARVAAKLQSLFGDSPSTVPAEVPSPPKMPRRDAPLEITRFAPGSVAHVMLGYLGLRVGDPDRYALDVVAEILGGSSGGRLASAFQDGGIALGTVAVSYEAFEPGFFAVSASVRPDADGDPDPDPIKAVVTKLRAQLARLVEEGVTPEELARARQLLVGRSALAFERRGAVAMALSIHGAFSETVASYRADSEELARVTLADVLRAARRVLVPAQEILVVVRPREQEKPIVGINRISAEYTLR